MSCCSQASTFGSKTPYMRSGIDSGSNIQDLGTSPARDLFTQQTGQVLLELGTLLNNIGPLDEHVDRNTGDLLISIGSKLMTRK